MIKCITFDLDDTLWAIEPVILEAEQRFHGWLKKNYPIVADNFDILSLRQLMKKTASDNPDIKHNLTEVRIKGYTYIKDLYKLPDDMPLKSFKYFMKYRNKVKLYDGAENMLVELKKRYMIGTITNGNASLEKIGIKKFFDFEVKAADVGFMKPSSKIFEAALKKASCKPSEMVHIGDSYDKDIIGAKSVNMNYIWLNHKNTEYFDVEKSNIIRSISEIPKLLYDR